MKTTLIIITMLLFVGCNPEKETVPVYTRGIEIIHFGLDYKYKLLLYDTVYFHPNYGINDVNDSVMVRTYGEWIGMVEVNKNKLPAPPPYPWRGTVDTLTVAERASRGEWITVFKLDSAGDGVNFYKEVRQYIVEDSVYDEIPIIHVSEMVIWH